MGIAISSEAGVPRSLGPAAIAILEQLSLADDEMMVALREHYAGGVLSFNGEPVGTIRPALTISFANRSPEES